MNYTPAEVIKIQESGDCSDKDVLRLLDDCEEIVNSCDDYDEYFCYAYLLASHTDMRLSYDIIDRVLNILTIFRKNLKNAQNIADCEYAFLQIYTKLDFIPKIVEHSLNVLDAKESKPVFKYVANNELSLTTCIVGLYDLALHYSTETEKMVNCIDGISHLQLDIVNESNMAYIMALSGMRGEFPERLSRLKELVNLNTDNPAIQEIKCGLDIDILYMDSRLLGISDELVEKYLSLLNKFNNRGEGINHVFHSFSTDILLLNEMMMLGYDKECVEACQILISRPDCFSGDYCGLYKIIMDAYAKNPSCLTEKEHLEYQAKYIEALEKSKMDHEATIKRLVAEEFTIRKATSVINSLTQESETDSLTGCYNRHGFKKFSPSFYANFPDGAVIFIDIDNLKFANDHYGHEAGDLTITTFANTAKRLINPSTDRFFRYAGDEFIILTGRSQEEAEAMIEGILKILATPANFKGRDLFVKFSHGIATFSECPGPDCLEKTVKLADSRMYECKKHHKELDPTSVR